MDFSADQIAKLLIGAGFSMYAFDKSKPWWARLAYGGVGAYTLYSGYTNSPLLGVQSGAQKSGLTSDSGTPLKFEEVRVKTIAERVSKLHEQMAKGVRDPAVYKLAREILSQKCNGTWCVPEHDHAGECVALFNAVRERVRYTLDPTFFDAFQHPKKTLELKTADCDDQTSLLGAMLLSTGFSVKSRVVQTAGQPTWNHIYLVARKAPEMGGWMALDLAVNQPAGWEVPDKLVIKKRDFEVQEHGPQASILQLQSVNGLNGVNF